MDNGLSESWAVAAVVGRGEDGAPAAPAPATGGSPFKEYPDARQAPDGHWYVQKDGKYHRIDN